MRFKVPKSDGAWPPQLGTGERGKFNRVGKKIKKAKKRESHYVQTDDLPEPIVSHAVAGKKKVFTSKSAYNRHLKENGFRSGGDAERRAAAIPYKAMKEAEEREERERRQDVEESYFDVKYGRVEFTEQERETHLREERACQLNGIPKIKKPY